MVRNPKDLCKGCRECYNGILQAVVRSPIIAGIMMGIPTYFMLSCLLFDGTTLMYPEFYALKNNVAAPFYTLMTFTIIVWIVELIGIKMMLPNLLSMFAFGHAAVGSWWLVNFGILIFAGWSYLPVRMMFIFMIGVLTPAVVWHITADIVRKYKEKLIEQINVQAQALANQEIAFSPDPEIATIQITGKPKHNY